MSRFVSFNSLAEAELNEAVVFYDLQVAGLGRDFLHAAERTIAGLLDFPESGAVVRGRVRRKLLPRFPYAILYRIRGDEIRILAVKHDSRRPTYWYGRT